MASSGFTKVAQAAALALSVVTSPFIVTPVTVTLVVLLLHPPAVQLREWAAIAVVCGAGVPFLYVFRLWRQGRISDVHVAIREQREGPFIATLVGGILGVVGLCVAHAPRQLVALGCVYLALGLVLMLVSLRWKISVHITVLVACLVALALLGYLNALYAMAGVPLVLWSRVYRHKHTLTQVLVPVLLGLIVTPLAYWGALAVIPGR
jgi:hypothetical protein